jgi:hypothetical protein
MVVGVTVVMEVDVPCGIGKMFKERVHVFHSVLSEHIHNDLTSLVYAWVSICSLGSPCCLGITLNVWGFSDCGVEVGSNDE